MSVQQVENFRKLRAILKELASFGLNPNQWRMARIKSFGADSNSFTIYNLQDEDFRMQGSWREVKSGYEVQDLEVIGF